jgi:hypothetical protein
VPAGGAGAPAQLPAPPGGEAARKPTALTAHHTPQGRVERQGTIERAVRGRKVIRQLIAVARS